MIKYILILLIFISCKSKLSEAELNLIEQAISFNNMNASRNMNSLTKNYLDDNRVKKYYDAGKEIYEICKEFENYSESIELNKSQINTNEIVDEYKKKILLIEAIVKENEGLGLTLNLDNYILNTKGVSSDIILLKARLNLSDIKANLIIRLLGNTSSSPDWYQYDMTTQKDSSSNGYYAFNLNSIYLQQISLHHTFKIEIDTLMREGTIASKSFNSTKVKAFYKIEFDSLEKGNYYVKGHVNAIHNSGEIMVYPFKHKMKIN